MNTNPKAKRILCYGDSNVWGQIPGTFERYDATIRWTSLLQQLLANDYEIIEEGLPGRTAAIDDPENEGKNGATYLKSCLPSHSPLDLVVLMLGTNDIKKRYAKTPSQITQDIEELLSLIKNPEFNYNKNPDVILLSPPIVDESVNGVQEKYLGSEEKSKNLAQYYQKVAEKYNCEFVDTAKYVTSSKIDGYHWEPEAHQKLAEVLAERIKKIYG